MAWLAVDKDGLEAIYEEKPNRDCDFWMTKNILGNYIGLPEGTIEKILGRKLTWNDEPVELK